MEKMDAATQRELEQFIQLENQRAQLQAQIHQFTDRCWDKCMGVQGASLSLLLERSSPQHRVHFSSFLKHWASMEVGFSPSGWNVL
jgi:hypothetical protein